MKWMALAALALLAVPAKTLLGEACATFYRANDTLRREGDQAMYVFYRNGWQSIVLQAAFRGDVKDFAVCMALPSVPEFQMEKAEFFSEFREYTALNFRKEGGAESAGPDGDDKGESEVKVVKVQVSGAYKAVTLKATAAKALCEWLDENGYHYDRNAVGVFEEYAQKGWFFVTVKVIREDEAKEFDGRLRPMALRFKTAEPVIWTRFSALNPGGMTMNLYVVADSPFFVGEFPSTYTTRLPAQRWDGRGSASYPVTRVFSSSIQRANVARFPNLSRVIDQDVWLPEPQETRDAMAKLLKEDPAEYARKTAPRYEGLWITRFMGHASQEMLSRQIHFVPEKAWDRTAALGLSDTLKRMCHDADAREKIIECLKSSAAHVEADRLTGELSSPETGLRRAFAEAIGALKLKPCVPALIDAMDKEENYFSKTAMRDALAAITGQRHKITEAAKYREWWEKNR
jgi:hypothetical protein